MKLIVIGVKKFRILYSQQEPMLNVKKREPYVFKGDDLRLGGSEIGPKSVAVDPKWKVPPNTKNSERGEQSKRLRFGRWLTLSIFSI